MIALYEQEMGRRAWLSTDVPDELPSLSPVGDRDERLPTFVHDNDVLSVLEPADTTWEDTDAEEPPEDAPASEMAIEAGDPETDNVLAQYFGRFAVLLCSALPRNKRLGDALNAGSGASAGLYTSPVACRRYSGSSIGLSIREYRCARSCSTARRPRLTRPHGWRNAGKPLCPAGFCHTSESSGRAWWNASRCSAGATCAAP